MTLPTARLPVLRRALLGCAAGLVLALACALPATASEVSVSLDTARAQLAAGDVLMFDIREPREHATGVAAGARLLPMSELRSRLAEIPADPTRPVLLICNTQNRSSATLKALQQRGYTHVRFVEGGMSEWNRRGWPVVKPEH